MKKILAATALAAALWAPAAGASSEAPTPPSVEWSFNGLFGTFDRGQLQRGYQVYAEVCHSCHALSLMAFRNLQQIGFSEEQVAQLAAQFEVQDGPNDEGDMFMRPARASDHVPSPFANEQAARFANNGAYPPDQSLIVKARKGGSDYIHGILVGYRDPPPEGVTLNEGMHFNDYFPGHQIAMAPPLSDGRVEYADGTEATLDQQAKDVTAFLTWVSEPTLEERRRLGISVILFLIVLTGLLYALKRQIWSDVDH
ncbi:MAG: cytochrome c1 [Rhodospirillales bacterium]|nr:cytochrome c1 [Rhodospirillales bacterium]